MSEQQNAREPRSFNELAAAYVKSLRVVYCVTCGKPDNIVDHPAFQSVAEEIAAAEQSRAAQVVEIASLRADRDRCADSYQQEKAARIVAEAERDRWRKLATDARPYVDTSPDWLERFDAEAGTP